MTKRDAQRYAWLVQGMAGYGFSQDEVDALLRIQGTLHNWAEEECNGTIQRDGDDGDGKPFRVWEDGRGVHHKAGHIPDRERGALKRLAVIMAKHPGYLSYHQGDPRGCSLYIVPESKLDGLDIDCCYSRGMGICYK